MKCPSCGIELNDPTDFTVCPCGAHLRRERRAFGPIPWIWTLDEARLPKGKGVNIVRGHAIDNNLEYARYLDGVVTQILPEGKTIETKYESVVAVFKAGWRAK